MVEEQNENGRGNRRVLKRRIDVETPPHLAGRAPPSDVHLIILAGLKRHWFLPARADRCLQAREMLATACFARQTARCARRGGQPPHPPKITRLLHCYRPPFVCTALCMYRLVCAPPVLLCIRLAALDAGASPRTPLRLVLRCAVRHSLSSFCRKQGKESMHDTQCIHHLGLFIVRRRFV